tara:strand:+ start:169 stop:516 length:348 start_codon:yes stop_codon:yes gene_type:complete
MKKLKAIVSTGVLSLMMTGCYETYSYRNYNRPVQRTCNRPVMSGYSRSSYGVIRDRHRRVIRRRGAVWGTVPSRPRCRPYNIGLPNNPTSENIRRKFRRDVEYLRRMRARQRRRR